MDASSFYREKQELLVSNFIILSWENYFPPFTANMTNHKTIFMGLQGVRFLKPSSSYGNVKFACYKKENNKNIAYQQDSTSQPRQIIVMNHLKC